MSIPPRSRLCSISIRWWRTPAGWGGPTRRKSKGGRATGDPAQKSEAREATLIAWCRERLIKWSCPREVEFRADLPKTRIGKIDYRALVEDHAAKHAAGKNPS